MKKLPSSVSFLATFFIALFLSERVSAAAPATQERQFQIVLNSERALFTCRMKLGKFQRTAGTTIKSIRISEDSGPQEILALKKSLIPDQTVANTMENLFTEIDKEGKAPSPILKKLYDDYLDRKHNEDATKRGRFWIFEVISGKRQLILETAGTISVLEVDHNEHPDADFFLVQFTPLTDATPVRINSGLFSEFSGSRIGFPNGGSEFNSLASLTSAAVLAIAPNAISDSNFQFPPVRVPLLAYRGSKVPNGTEIIFIPDVSP
ncbi:MAG: hypothetical protein IPK68_03470 [Bdellovibrionales bacterium]|nr:hypothetical protein [Bdellovibrionales bacterium]